MKKSVLLFLLPAMMLGIVSCGAAESAITNESGSTNNSAVEALLEDKDAVLQQGQSLLEDTENSADEESSGNAKISENGKLIPEATGEVRTEGIEKVSFPDWKGYTDDTLAMNSM